MRSFDVVVIGAGPGGLDDAGQVPWIKERGITVTAAEVPVRRLRHAIPAFPTRSGIWLHLVGALGR